MPKRIRLPGEMPYELRKLLVRVARVNAQASNIVKIYTDPDGVGGGLDPEGDNNNFIERAKRQDRTLLYDFLNNALGEMSDIMRELDAMNARDAGGPAGGERPHTHGRQ